jgi:hypothetical protein
MTESLFRQSSVAERRQSSLPGLRRKLPRRNDPEQRDQAQARKGESPRHPENAVMLSASAKQIFAMRRAGAIKDEPTGKNSRCDFA